MGSRGACAGWTMCGGRPVAVRGRPARLHRRAIPRVNIITLLPCAMYDGDPALGRRGRFGIAGVWRAMRNLGDAASTSGPIFGVVLGDSVGECDASGDQRHWFGPFRRRHVFAAASTRLKTIICVGLCESAPPLGSHHPVPDGGDDALDRVARAKMIPMLGREVARSARRTANRPWGC